LLSQQQGATLGEFVTALQQPQAWCHSNQPQQKTRLQRRHHVCTLTALTADQMLVVVAMLQAKLACHTIQTQLLRY
jgi:hypothetical protein